MTNRSILILSKCQNTMVDSKDAPDTLGCSSKLRNAKNKDATPVARLKRPDDYDPGPFQKEWLGD